MPFLNAGSLRNVDVAQHFDQGRKSDADFVGDFGDIDHHAIDADAKLVVIGLGFQVNIRRPGARADQQQQAENVDRFALGLFLFTGVFARILCRFLAGGVHHLAPRADERNIYFTERFFRE